MTTPEPLAAGPHRLRASDAEREQVAQQLSTAMTEGRLTLDEGAERLGAVYASRYRDELTLYTADLPGAARNALAEAPKARPATRRGPNRPARYAAVIALLLVSPLVLSFAFFGSPIIPAIVLLVIVLRQRHRGRLSHGYYWQHQPGPSTDPASCVGVAGHD